GGAEGVTYPLIADTNRTVSDRFGTLNGQFDYDEYGRLTATSDLTCHRGTFILDKEGVILHQSYNFAPLGRDIDAVIRELDAIRRLQIDGQVCMPNWKG
ncbi:MAG: redoxin domain-containing protein, partial [Bacteroidota bacterium]|nr:redoxin domain-containing protein [Bacteroidota bacterium]